MILGVPIVVGAPIVTELYDGPARHPILLFASPVASCALLTSHTRPATLITRKYHVLENNMCQLLTNLELLQLTLALSERLG